MTKKAAIRECHDVYERAELLKLLIDQLFAKADEASGVSTRFTAWSPVDREELKLALLFISDAVKLASSDLIEALESCDALRNYQIKHGVK